MNKIEFFKDIIEEYEELLRELENENAPIDAIELVKESIRTNKILLENCILREEETKALEVAEDSAPEEDSGLTVGRVFKNYKELCKFMGWKPTGGDYKKARLKELDTLCKWHKEGNKIIIDDVFAEVKNKEDGRSKNNVFVNPVEVILLFALKDSEKSEVYFSNSKIYRLLGLFNERYAELQYSDTSYIVEELMVDYLTVKSFKINSKSEANKIIKRALESLRKRKIIDYFEGRIIVGIDFKHRLASMEEAKVLTDLEKETLKEMGYVSFNQVEYHNKYSTYNKILNEKIDKKGFENYKYSYRGYAVGGVNKIVASEINRQCNDNNFKLLNDLFIDKMQRVAKSRNKSAVKKAEELTTFGEAILEGEASASFISDYGKMINYYIKH